MHPLKFGPVWVAGMLLLAVIVTGCAQPSGNPPLRDPPSDEIGTFFDDFTMAMTPTDHWYIAHSRNYPRTNAAIMAKTRDAVILVGCTDDDKTVGFYVELKETPSGNSADHAILMALDGGAAEPLGWLHFKQFFVTSDRDSGFGPVVEKLKSHKEMELIVNASGRTVQRAPFTLNGAGKALDAVITGCARQ